MTEHLKQESPAQTIERCGKHGADWIGDKDEFRYVGVDAPRATAKAIFDAHGFGDFVVEDPRPETVLKDTAKRGATPDGYIQRPFVSPNTDTPLAIHVTKVTGNDESGDSYDCLARVRIGHRSDPATGAMVPFAIARPPEGKTEYTDSAARERALWIAEATNHRLNHVLTSDASAATRKALESVGCVKSLGGGNNYWAPAAIGERVHAFLDDVAAKLGAYYLRTPITTLGAPHAKVAFAQAVQVSLESDLGDLEGELEKALQSGKSPKLTKKGTPRKKTATLKHKIELAQAIQGKVALYRAVIDSRLTKRLDALSKKLEDNFTTLLDGGEVFWGSDDKSAPPSSEEESAPTTARSPGSVDVAAAPASGPELKDPFGWA